MNRRTRVYGRPPPNPFRLRIRAFVARSPTRASKRCIGYRRTKPSVDPSLDSTHAHTRPRSIECQAKRSIYRHRSIPSHTCTPRRRAHTTSIDPAPPAGRPILGPSHVLHARNKPGPHGWRSFCFWFCLFFFFFRGLSGVARQLFSSCNLVKESAVNCQPSTALRMSAGLRWNAPHSN